MDNELRVMAGKNEKILFEGKPDLKCFILESIFNPLLPFAIVWLIFDTFFFGGFASSGGPMGFLIPFMLIHLMPVWIYLGGILFMARKYRNLNYLITDRAIYISSGIFTKSYNTKTFMELSRIDIHRGIFDQMCNVGDVICTTNQYRNDGQLATIKIESVPNYMDVYNMVKQLQTDIYTDVMYPNDKRPETNHGYKTTYNNDDFTSKY